ncbi:hypothetical protein V1264_010847 [Littorina saxatilis]|uniref:Uncharacterized protein n=1 Tax=Littorina saxatilis TaxID=31220 RepID=A0AAN9BTN7_9CAEN
MTRTSVDKGRVANVVDSLVFCCSCVACIVVKVGRRTTPIYSGATLSSDLSLPTG